MTHNQVVISGSGVIGLATACLLGQHGYQVTVLDPVKPTLQKGTLGRCLRTLALSPASIDFLKVLGVAIDSSFQKIRHMAVWERDGTGCIAFDPNAALADYLALTVEQDELQLQLLDVAKELGELKFGLKIEALDQRTNEIRLTDNTILEPGLLIVAEGPTSRTCQLLDIKQKSTDLNQHAIATIVQSDQAHRGRAIQRFAPTPFALLPMADPHLLSLIWSIPDAKVQELQSMDETEFLAAANAESELRVGSLLKVDQRVAFPLKHQLIHDLNPRSNVLVLGDSAHTVHPLAGQGINLGLEDVRALKPILHAQPESLAKPGLWRQYNHRRRVRARSIMTLMSAFSKAWEIKNPYLHWARNAAVRFVDQNLPLKRQLIKEAMGLGPLAQLL